MNLAEAAKVAMTAIGANRMRSALTVLGVVIGVMSVVLLVAVGTGARNEVTAGVEDLGSNLLFVVPGSFEFGQAPTLSKFTLDDVDRIERGLGAGVSVSGNLASGETVRADNVTAFASVVGVTSQFDAVLNREVGRGEFLTDSDVATGRRVAVLGSAAADALFPATDPIAKPVTIAGLRYRVVGVLDPLGASLGVDRDSQVLVPITAAQRLFGTRRVDTIFIKADAVDDLDAVTRQVDAILSERLDAEEFSVVNQEEILGVAGQILDTLTFVLAAIAGISLLVGGIGVSNIMLVSVQERTREIGLRKAVGARQRDVLLQFLIEAVLLTSIGGVLGIGLGIGGALGLSAAFDQLPALITWWSPALAFGVSAAVGLFFGVVPARRAGRLDPVAALRSE